MTAHGNDNDDYYYAKADAEDYDHDAVYGYDGNNDDYSVEDAYEDAK